MLLRQYQDIMTLVKYGHCMVKIMIICKKKIVDHLPPQKKIRNELTLDSL